MSLDQDIVIGCAFRYALGRMTYVVDSVASEIERQVTDISSKTLYRMDSEIDDALHNEGGGMEMDRQRWQECQAIIVDEINYRVRTKNLI